LKYSQEITNFNPAIDASVCSINCICIPPN
jgi:hypothetical protein